MIEIILTIILFLFIITFIVCLHELGHYLVAKSFGVFIEEYSIGMGPLVYKKVIKGTQYSIRALPIGGYVKMLGEGESKDQIGSYSKLKAWKRLLIIYAGVLMNFLITVVFLSILSISSAGNFFALIFNPDYKYPIADNRSIKIAVSSVEQDSPAQKAGLKEFDVINKVDNVDYNTAEEFRSLVNANLEKPIPLEIYSFLGGPSKTVSVTPRDKEIHKLSDEQGPIGFHLVQVPIIRVQYNGWQRPFAGLFQTINGAHHYMDTVGTIIGAAFQRGDITIVSDSLNSPMSTYAATKKFVDVNGIWGVLTIVALLSLAIGIMNALPFPSLDGWHGLFIIIEMITGKKVKESIYNTITLIGFVLLLTLGVLIVIKDITIFDKLF
jgi:regulator of sigma E protease